MTSVLFGEHIDKLTPFDKMSITKGVMGGQSALTGAVCPITGEGWSRWVARVVNFGAEPGGRQIQKGGGGEANGIGARQTAKTAAN